MKNNIAFIVCYFYFTLVSNVISQELYDYNWVFRNEDLKNVVIEFNGNNITFNNLGEGMSISSSNASMSNSIGELMFYTNGCHIRNRYNKIIKNSENLNYNNGFNSYCNDKFGDYNVGPQSMLSLPDPNNKNRYYLIHQSIVKIPGPIYILKIGQLLYTVVDFRRGLEGEVPTFISPDSNVYIKNIEINNDTTLESGNLTAVKHKNVSDWWIINPKEYGNGYIKFLLNSNGINQIEEQEIGEDFGDHSTSSGSAVFTPDGSKYLRYFPKYKTVGVMDFNRETGQLSNYRSIKIEHETQFGSIAVSPNSRFAYVSSHSHLYQFDLLSTDINSSVILIDIFDGKGSPNPPFYNYFNISQLGPDCRIYITSLNSCNDLHVIKYPDRQGKDCMFLQHALKLPGSHGGSLPQFPNYRLDIGPVCDSSINLPTSILESNEYNYITIYPNPATNKININIDNPTDRNLDLKIFNLYGNLVLSKNLELVLSHFEFKLDQIPEGLYIYTIKSKSGLISSGKIIKN